METAVFTCWLLSLLFGPAVPMCSPSEFTLYVEKPECDYCAAINTTICKGYCRTWEKNWIRDYGIWDFGSRRVKSQSSCTYDQIEYRTAHLPGCPMDSNPFFTYPVALSCHCDTCKRSSSECTQRAGSDRAWCTKPVRRAASYLGQNSYMIPF